jgi:hypothetical protein
LPPSARGRGMDCHSCDEVNIALPGLTIKTLLSEIQCADYEIIGGRTVADVWHEL